MTMLLKRTTTVNAAATTVDYDNGENFAAIAIANSAATDDIVPVPTCNGDDTEKGLTTSSSDSTSASTGSTTSTSTVATALCGISKRRQGRLRKTTNRGRRTRARTRIRRRRQCNNLNCHDCCDCNWFQNFHLYLKTYKRGRRSISSYGLSQSPVEIVRIAVSTIVVVIVIVVIVAVTSASNDTIRNVDSNYNNGKLQQSHSLLHSHRQSTETMTRTHNHNHTHTHTGRTTTNTNTNAIQNMDEDIDINLLSPISKQELQNARQSLQNAKQHKLSPLRPIDQTKYTVRINTWQRNKQLVASVQHWLTCPGVAQIQIVWCETIDEEHEGPGQSQRESPGKGGGVGHSDSENEPKKKRMTDKDDDDDHRTKKSSLKFKRPPQEIINYTIGPNPPVVIEYHTTNSLNERFHILPSTLRSMPTYGILSVDDDVLRPCEALDDGFFRWTDHPDRMVGYDYRMHIASDRSRASTATSGITRTTTATTWSYGYLSSSRKHNKYSMVLPRFSFIHADYLSLYTTYIPERIQKTIDEHFNCEDIAMSFFVSSMTQGKVPLLANQWSMLTMVKLSSERAISQTANHKSLRDQCVDDFGYLLGLKDGYAALVSGGDADNDVDTYSSSGNFEDAHDHSHGENDGRRESWMILQNHKIWKSNKRKSVFGVGADVSEHPFHVRDDFIQRRKDFVNMLKQWSRGNGSFQDAHRELINKIRNAGLLSAS